ncbi:MAG: hypothetical protein Q9210_005634 [Variospora velana]
MTLSGDENARYANIRDLLEISAESGSPELIKKLIKLDGLVKCFQKCVANDPDTIESFFDELKDGINKAKTLKRQEAERKRVEKKKKREEEAEIRVAKRTKLKHTPLEETPEVAETTVSDVQNEETTATQDQTEDEEVSMSSDHEASRGRSTTRLSEETLGSDVMDDASGAEDEDDIGGMRADSQRDSESMDNDAASTSQPSLSPSASSEPDDDDGIQHAHLSTITSRARSLSIAPEIPDMDSSIPEDPPLLTVAENSNVTILPAGRMPGATIDELPLMVSETANGITSVRHGPTSNTAVPTAQGSASEGAVQLIASSNTVAIHVSLQAKGIHPRKRKDVEHLETKIINQVWPHFSRRTSIKKRDSDMIEILTMIERLNFWTIQWRILKFAERRLKTPGLTAKVSQLADTLDPVAVFHAIEASSATEADAKLHRIHGQVRLVKSIQHKVGQGYKPREATLIPGTTQIEYPKYFRKDMADSMTEGESKEIKTKTLKRLDTEYKAGRRWIEAIDTFQGSGILFLFVLAEISCHALSQTYTKFQHACVKFLLSQISSLTQLVGCFENNALEKFCREGYIDDMTIGRIRDCKGPTVAVADGGDDTGEE